jgi:hypothetical protein
MKPTIRIAYPYFALTAFFLCSSCFVADALPPPTEPAPAPSACSATTEQPLAFWFGHWEAFADDKLDGHSFIERTLGGCAVLEHWYDVSGFEGMSLFYFEPHLRQWKQVWVTDHALTPGGLKEKTMIYSSADLVRFQGTVWVTPDRSILDRTTLHKLDGGDVSQIIEYSKDGGATWIKTYDAIYRPHSLVPPAK